MCSRPHNRCNANWDRSNAYDFVQCVTCIQKSWNLTAFLIFWPNYCVCCFSVSFPNTIALTSFWITQAQTPCHRAATTAERPMRSGVAIVALLRQAGRAGPLYPQALQAGAHEILKMQRLKETNLYFGTCNLSETKHHNQVQHACAYGACIEHHNLCTMFFPQAFNIPGCKCVGFTHCLQNRMNLARGPNHCYDCQLTIKW